MTIDSPTIHDEPPDQVEKRERRREADGKAAHVAETRIEAETLAAQVAADPPGAPTLAELIRLARDNAAEPALYRLAHEARAPWKPSQWSAAVRSRLATALADGIRTRKTSNPKTIVTPKAKG